MTLLCCSNSGSSLIGRQGDLLKACLQYYLLDRKKRQLMVYVQDEMWEWGDWQSDDALPKKEYSGKFKLVLDTSYSVLNALSFYIQELRSYLTDGRVFLKVKYLSRGVILSDLCPEFFFPKYTHWCTDFSEWGVLLQDIRTDAHWCTSLHPHTHFNSDWL